jgi:hypothetical protein
MVSLTLGMIVLGAVVAVYINSKRTFNVVNQRIAMQQDAHCADADFARSALWPAVMAVPRWMPTIPASQAVPDTSAVSSSSVYQTFITSGGYLRFHRYASGTASRLAAVRRLRQALVPRGMAVGTRRPRVASGGSHFFCKQQYRRAHTRTAVLGSQYLPENPGKNRHRSRLCRRVGECRHHDIRSRHHGPGIRAYFVNSSSALVMTELGQGGTLQGRTS